jgi:outer membrane protein assembly factor BamB
MGLRFYHIYWIKDEFAYYFYGREKVFYNLFYDWMHSKGEYKGILDLQVKYITQDLPVMQLFRLLRQKLSWQKGFIVEGNTYRLESAGKNESTLEIQSEKMVLKASGSYDSETLFFESLRNFNGRLLALDFDNGRFGWVKPLKERKYV